MKGKLSINLYKKIKLLEQATSRAVTRKRQSYASLKVTERGGIRIDRNEILESRNFRAAQTAYRVTYKSK